MNEEQKQEVEKMRHLLIGLPQTDYWKAIQWYNNLSRIQIDATNRSIDPVKDPTGIARNQGMWLGIGMMEAFICEEIERINEKQDIDNKNKKQ